MDRKNGSGLSISTAQAAGENRDCFKCNINDYSSACETLQEEINGRWTAKRKLVENLSASYKRLGFDGKSDRTAACGTWLQFFLGEGAGPKLHNANFCRDRLCQLCNWRRSLKLYTQLSQIMDVADERGYRYIFLTFTARNCKGEDLGKTVDNFLSGWRKLVHNYRDIRRALVGSFRSLEVTYNSREDTYHPHIHIVAAVDKSYFKSGYISQAEWAAAWADACGLDYIPITDVRAVRSRGKKCQIRKIVCEVAKYMVKGADLSSDNVVYWLLNGLAGRRLVSFTGCFAKIRKELRLEDFENGDLVLVGNEEIRSDVAGILVNYRWFGGEYVMDSVVL